MMTLRCTRKLLDRLGLPSDLGPNATPGNALGDWYANLVRFGRDQFVIVVNERTSLAVLLPAKGVRHSLVPDLLRAVRWLLEQFQVPQDVIDRELAAMQPMAFGRTASRSVLAIMNERAHMAEHAWRRGDAPADVMLFLARMIVTSGPAQEDGYSFRAARRLLGLDPMPPPPATVVRLRVSLDGLSPEVWRRLVVPESIELPDLHRAIQLAMGWKDYHLHEFAFGDHLYGTPDEDYPIPGLREERGVRLGDAVRPVAVDRFTYRYDYGDDWLHEVVVESIGPNAKGFRGVTCLDGANACPPEDVGGTHGYLEFLQEVRDPAHEGHRDAVHWAGGRFDPSSFDLRLVNALLGAEFGT